ncbi:MAG: alpha/beta hydrolase [Panacagrimonas sp.]
MVAHLAQKQQSRLKRAPIAPAPRRGRVGIDRVVAAPSARALVTTRVIRWLCRSVERHFEDNGGLLRLRRQLELFDRARGLFGIGRSERFTWDRGALNGVRVRIVQPASTSRSAEPPSTLLYLHGGAFLLRTLNAHMDLAAGIAREAGLHQAILPIYRLAPECPYPAAIDDCMAAYVGLLNRGVPPGGIALGGDSAGGGLVLELLMRLRERGLPMPSCGVLISPFTDMSCSGRSIETNAGVDPMFGRIAALHVRFYLGGTDPRDPQCSPLFGRFEGLPPLMVQVGSTERLLDDSIRLAPRIRRAGGELHVQVWNDMPHVWQAMALPESAQAIAALGRFIRDHRRRASLQAVTDRRMNIAA